MIFFESSLLFHIIDENKLYHILYSFKIVKYVISSNGSNEFGNQL